MSVRQERLLPATLDIDGPFPRLSRRLRLGVVGGGRIAVTQAMAARMTGYWEVVAGALSSDPDRAAARAAEWDIPADRSYGSFVEMATAEMQRDDGVDAVMITTPNHVHAAAASAFLSAGIDVLCDKPLTNTLDEALALQQKVADTRLIFGVCYVVTCFPMIRQAQEIVQSGALGTINQIHVEFLQDWMVPDNIADAAHVKWRLDPAQSGPTSCVGDIGTHAVHLASFVSGLKLTSLRAEMHVCGAPKPLEDTVFMLTRFGDVPGTMMATRLASGNRGGLRLRIFGSKGGLEWDMENAERLELNLYGQPDQVITRGHGHGISKSVERLIRTGRGFPEGLIEAWANLYAELAIAVAARRDGQSLPPDYLRFPEIDAGVDGVRFIEATVESHKNDGKWVACD